MRLPSLRRSPQSAHAGARVDHSFDRVDDGINYYDGVFVGAATIGARALDPATAGAAYGALESLEEDDYFRYVRRYVAEGRTRIGADWRYADIVTVLYAAAELIRPASYLEIGVRRGRSMAAVAARAPRCTMIGVDLWQESYAGMENPGPEHVRAELHKLGFEGSLELVSGNSHEVLPRLFRERPELSFDLITVDGDHSRRGAARDLNDVLPRLRTGGAIVFDDIRHPAHRPLWAVWARIVESDRRYATWSFDDIGFGVAVAVRRW